MTVSAGAAARKVGELRGWSVTNLELQKILYVAQMVHLGRHGIPLMQGEFEAWAYGPVHPEVYRDARGFGSSPIKDVFFWHAPPLDSTVEGQTLREVVEFLRPLTASQLVAMTHWEGGAWARNYQPGIWHVGIPNEHIADEFRARQKSEAAA